MRTEFHPPRGPWPLTGWAAAGLLSLSAALPAQAGEKQLMPASVPKAYTQECGACHTAYPPGLLPAASWQRLMTGLDQHFGTDASLDEATVKQLATWLQANAGTYKRVRSEAPPQDRITQSAWFKREHRGIDAAVWSHASVRSAANCAACHSGAERGNFSERGLRFPAGLDLRYRSAWDD
ncbi:diheme cytochrome c [Azohydromonas lata]|uniref:diheme cytochrome c n=1 Tax=Azohydromonas lata TaxID=45677 RepID=UPI00082D4DA8|nr:diheme cytochrome c [Azohydromonas lata]